jgi:hypothetical protein
LVASVASVASCGAAGAAVVAVVSIAAGVGVVSVINQFCQVEVRSAPWRRFKKMVGQLFLAFWWRLRC